MQNVNYINKKTTEDFWNSLLPLNCVLSERLPAVEVLEMFGHVLWCSHGALVCTGACVWRPWESSGVFAACTCCSQGLHLL